MTGDTAMVVLAVIVTLVALGLLIWYLRDAAAARQPARRQRAAIGRDPREALSLLGNALAATHDPRALLPVILEVTVEATAATGGRLLERDRELAHVGEESAEPPDRIPLSVTGDDTDTIVMLFPPEGGFSDETAQLARWLVSQAAIALENAELHDVVQRQAMTDELTGLANRRRFMEALGVEIERAERFGRTLALVLADIDDFKRINDRFGHHVGDEALRRFAGLLTAELREIDVAGRLGGEEFAVLLPETDLEGALVAAGRIRRAAEDDELVLSDAVRVRFTASLGVASHEGDAAEGLLRRADAALYQAKAEGKNRVSVAGAV